MAWFTPGTIHRLVNHGGLRITVVMQNSGLPEAGDAVLTLPPDRLTDPDTYAAAVRLPTAGSEQDQVVAARARRDLATRRFVELREAVAAGDPEPLAAFHRAAAELVRPRLAEWERRWREGAHAAATATRDQLAALGGGDPSHLAAARTRAGGPTATGRFGMCGRLDVYHDA